jgi:hypothetical protein
MLHGRVIDGIRKPKIDMSGEPIKREIDNWRGVKGQNLTQDETADDGDAERTAKLGTNPSAKR